MKRRNVIVEIVKTEQGTMAIWAFITKLIIGQEWKWKCVQRKLDGRSVGNVQKLEHIQEHVAEEHE